MKKVININFQGRVVPIEESAYDNLKQYTESLRQFFANEEGKDEIINDIEGRIAELFAETLKRGSTCISDEDMDKIIISIGRPEDFETEEVNVQEQLGGNRNNSKSQQQSNSSNSTQERQRLYRDETDKVAGGVAGGLAHYLRVDASILRILFVLLTFGGGSGILIYLLLWIILPSRRLQPNLNKRLYRNGEEKVLGGVASGLSAYFNIAVWIPRLIFAFPLVIGIINTIFRNFLWMNVNFPSFYFGSFGGSLTLAYLVLWAVIPEATTASEKLEMRGDKVDLNSIKNTIQEDLDGFKDKAKKWGDEFGASARESSQKFSSEFANASRTAGGKIGHGISIVFKAFFLFVAGMLAFMLLMFLAKIFFGGVNIIPMKNYIINGQVSDALLWTAIIGFLVVPILAFVVWVIRRVLKTKAYHKQFSATVGILWTIGLIAAIALAVQISNQFSNKQIVESNEFVLKQPSINKLYINVAKQGNSYSSKELFDFNYNFDEDFDDNVSNEEHGIPYYGNNVDSILLRDVRINLAKSSDDNYHVKMFKISRGNGSKNAAENAQQINFKIDQQDSVLILPNGFFVTQKSKFRNQQVLLIVEIPVGKKIEMDGSLDLYDWFSFRIKRKNRLNLGWKDSWDESLHWEKDREMMMTERRLVETKMKDGFNNDEIENINEDEDGSIKITTEDGSIEINSNNKKVDSIAKPKVEKPEIKINVEDKKGNTTKSGSSNNGVYLGTIMLDKLSI